MQDLTGKAFRAMRGPFVGMVIRVVGRGDGDPILDRWIVEIVNGARWTMSGERIRSALRESEVQE